MKRTMSLLLIAVILFSTFVLAAPTATRSIEGNKVTVSLKGMTSNSGEVNEILVGGVILTGTVPIGCAFNANSGVADTKLKCTIQSTVDTTITYQTSGSGTVSGTFSYFVAPTTQKITITGDSKIPKTAAPKCPTGATGTPPACSCPDMKAYNTMSNTCNTPPPPCTPSWQCADWGACTSGTQSRTCTDLNKCTAGSTKTESQTCTVTPSSSDCANLCDADQQSCLDEGYGEIDCTSTYNSCIAACPTTNGAQCGNNIKEGTEVCDGPDLGGQTCMSINPANVGGFLTCSSDCKGIKTSNCVQSSNQLLTCVDSDTIAVNDAKEGVSYPTSYKYINLNDKGSVTFKNATGVVVGAAEPDSCDPVTGKVVERFCDDKGNLAKEEIACPTGKSCVGGACVSSGADVGGEIQVTAKDQQESYLFQRIHDALEKNSGSPLKQISSVAGVFQCYFDSSCKLGEYKVK